MVTGWYAKSRLRKGVGVGVGGRRVTREFSSVQCVLSSYCRGLISERESST